MALTTPVDPGTPWVRLTTSQEDWDDADPILLATMLGQLHLIRAFEESVLELAGEGLVHGPAHSSIGREGRPTGPIVALCPSEAVNGSHRGHHHFLAEAMADLVSGGDLENLVDEAIAALLSRTAAEILGLAEGFCRVR